MILVWSWAVLDQRILTVCTSPTPSRSCLMSFCFILGFSALEVFQGCGHLCHDYPLRQLEPLWVSYPLSAACQFELEMVRHLSSFRWLSSPSAILNSWYFPSCSTYSRAYSPAFSNCSESTSHLRFDSWGMAAINQDWARRYCPLQLAVILYVQTFFYWCWTFSSWTQEWCSLFSGFSDRYVAFDILAFCYR